MLLGYRAFYSTVRRGMGYNVFSDLASKMARRCSCLPNNLGTDLMAIDGMRRRFWESGGMIRFPLHNRMTLDGSDVTFADVKGWGGSRSERVVADFLLFDRWVRF